MTQKKSLISKRSAVKKANLANATNAEKPSVSAPISGSVKPRLTAAGTHIQNNAHGILDAGRR